MKTIQLFSTCPQSKDLPRERYLEEVINVSRWSEAAGCTAMLVYTDNSLADPWLVSQLVLENTTTLAPLVAVQPLYMHPYAAAKKVTTYAHLFGRRIYLNMLAGGFKNDLLALGDNTPHDDRYLRTTEYTNIIKGLLASPEPFTFTGKYYTVKNLKMTPPLPAEHFPGIMMSGSSEAGLAAARALDVIAVKYPKPPGEEAVQAESTPPGIRVGIIARENAEEAWRVGLERFPEDRKGQIAHSLAMKTSDSHWHKQLSEMSELAASEDNPYWLGPFKNYRTFCPYLVGSYTRVAEELQRYLDLGFENFILDIPPSEEELLHIRDVFDRVARVSG